MSDTYRSALRVIFIAPWPFFLLLAFVAGVIHFEVRVLDSNVGEDTFVEYCQELFVLISALLFYRIAQQDKELRSFAVLAGTFFLCMFIREMDQVLDQIVHGFWKYPAWFIALISIGYSLKHKEQTAKQLLNYCQHPSFGMMLAGLGTLLVYSRLFGMQVLWRAALDDNYMRVAKNLGEEGTELLGYAIILAAAVWFFVSWKNAIGKVDNNTRLSAS